MALKASVERICSKCGANNIKEDGDYIWAGHDCPYKRCSDGIPMPTTRHMRKDSVYIKENTND